MDEEKIFYNAVCVGLEGDYRKISKLRQRVSSWKNAYEILRQSGCPPDPETEIKRLEKIGVRLLLFGDAEFPMLLREIHDPPFGIYILGSLAQEAAIAIVGTRRGTPDGKSIAREFARTLAECDFAIASGLALGIDTAAHSGCLDGQGKSIAILANGLDAIYPATNDRLARKTIEKGGSVISEYPLRSPPLPYRFLERNRIISGLSKGIVVIECPENSGSLATARFALEQNRDVFVVPGPITHPNFLGSHALIRQGAELVTSTRDILLAYGVEEKEKRQNGEVGQTSEEKLILLALRGASAPLEFDKLIEITKLEPRIVNQALAFLIIRNVIKETGVGYIID